MKGIDKKACMRSLEPVSRPSADCGLFFVEPIKYVIRSTVKLVGGRRLLILCLYTRGDAPGGKAELAYTIFQASDAFITYDHAPLVKNRWRSAMLDNLEHGYGYRNHFAFYSKSDEERVIRFCAKCTLGGKVDSGLIAMYRIQSGIRDVATHQRKRKREQKIHSRMEGLRALPRNLNDWIRKKVLPSYFFYDYKRGAKAVKGTCSACGQEAELPGIRHNGEGICPSCRRKFVAKSNAKRGKLTDRVTTSVIQKTAEDELVIRIMKTWSTWPKGEPQKLDTYEETRIFVRMQEDGTPISEAYHNSFESAGVTPWKTGYPPIMYIYGPNFNAETCGALYCHNLKRELAGTPWQYCPIQLFYETDCQEMEVLPFLTGHLRHPRVEHLVKVGFTGLAADIVYRGDYNHELDETKNRTHQILGVMAEDIPFLREINPDISTLKTFKEYCRLNLKDRQSLLLWQLKNDVKMDILQVLEYVTPHKMMRYLDEQYPAMAQKTSEYGATRYRNMQDVQREYRDYLDMCKKERYNLRNSFVLFPADLQDAHDKVAQRIKLKADAKKRRSFMEAYRRIVSQLDFTMDGMKIVYPSTPDEIVAEGHALHHCVGSYVDRVANKDCIILFLRKCDEENEPFYTIEVRGKKVIQVRGMKNADPTPEVKRFMSRWEKKVLRCASGSEEAPLEAAA